jgi:hypothetical protein
MMVMTRETVQAKPVLTRAAARRGRAVQAEYERWVRRQKPAMIPYLRSRTPSVEECLEALDRSPYRA